MDAKSLGSIIEQLEREKGALSAKAEKCRVELHAVERDIQKLTAALKALSGAEPTGAKSRPGKGRKSPAARAAGKGDVIRLVKAVLKEHAVLEREDLKAVVEKAVTENGFSRLGFSLRFSEALQEECFIDSPGGIRLAEPEPALP